MNSGFEVESYLAIAAGILRFPYFQVNELTGPIGRILAIILRLFVSAFHKRILLLDPSGLRAHPP